MNLNFGLGLPSSAKILPREILNFKVSEIAFNAVWKNKIDFLYAVYVPMTVFKVIP